MSKTISVKEAASALGITPRAVTYRLEKGQLKGTLNKNEFGVPEWRIFPNKEIMAGINSQVESTSPAAGAGPINFDPGDVIEAESVDAEQEEAPPTETRFATEFQSIVEQCVRPLVEEVKAQALALLKKIGSSKSKRFNFDFCLTFKSVPRMSASRLKRNGRKQNSRHLK